MKQSKKKQKHEREDNLMHVVVKLRHNPDDLWWPGITQMTLPLKRFCSFLLEQAMRQENYWFFLFHKLGWKSLQSRVNNYAGFYGLHISNYYRSVNFGGTLHELYSHISSTYPLMRMRGCLWAEGGHTWCTHFTISQILPLTTLLSTPELE